ncbi:hypothetical protein CH63R_06041 [Colletotrichum higginsianum IMI 349063]|uniref:Uncharacterized protein n=1 Tax=Colletotrichum higginsianum (strain IMI 349063) TaxID=759273 RepID=A0A1B7YE94_COLHI|nr:hypothetical protein CH63R_06041 [Colletotrichum higginsianum IMI 349063]OBR10349.1 hypothetical protein CH63R_06041 [Colletotrichum higginsianum IMI 349063]
MHAPRWLLATIPLVAFASGQKCYWPDGGEATSVVACPVAGGTEAASCCFRNHYCMSNGLCFSKSELSFYRGACTDQDWTTSGCPKYCDKEDIERKRKKWTRWLTVRFAVPGRHAGIAKCEENKYACQRTSNCANYTFGVPAGVMLLNQYLQSDIGESATPTATAAVSSTTGEASAATCPSTTTATAAASSGISTGAAAGIGVGIGAPMALAIGVLTVLLLREKKKTRAALSAQTPAGTAPTSPWAKSERTAYAPVEIQTQTQPPELPSNHQGRHELS